MSESIAIQREMHALDARDFQLWSIGLLVGLLAAAGFLAFVWPNVMWNLRSIEVEGRYLPQLFFGFIVLVALYNIYALDKKRALQRTREDLIRQLIRAEAAENLSMIDPLTQVFNRRYLEQILPKEVSRAERQGTGLTFLMIDIDEFKSINTHFGHIVGDRVLAEAAAIMKKTFRQSDTVIRYGGDEFLVLLSDANEREAECAVKRLMTQVDRWNRQNTIPNCKMGLSWGLAAYTKGANLASVLEVADKKMYQDKAAKHAGS